MKQKMMNLRVLAIDPGRDKCGVAVVTAAAILFQEVVATENLLSKTEQLVRTFQPQQILLGNGTTSRQARQRLQEGLPDVPLLVIDEYRTTEMARGLYWRSHPPKGWRRLLPVSMQVPPVPVDDFVAVLLAQRWLKKQQGEGGEEDA